MVSLHNFQTLQSDQLVQACGSGNLVSIASLLNGGAVVDSIGTDEFGVSDIGNGCGDCNNYCVCCRTLRMLYMWSLHMDADVVYCSWESYQSRTC